MTASDLFNEYLKFSEEEKQSFEHMLGMYMLIHMPDSEHVMLTRDEFTMLHRRNALFAGLMDAMRPFLDPGEKVYP